MSIYVGLIISGFVALIIYSIATFIGGFDLEVDAFEVEIFDFDVYLLPISVESISLALIVFGSVEVSWGRYDFLSHLVSGLLAYLSAVLIKCFTAWLRKHESLSDNESSTLYTDAEVIIPIPLNGYGSILCNRGGDSCVTYPARTSDRTEIKSGVSVKVLDIHNGIAVVEKK